MAGYAVGYHPALPNVRGMAIASMVLGIVGIVFAICFFPIGLILGIIGLPLGGVALSRINSGEVIPSGRGQAIAGVVLSILTLVIAIILLIVVVNADASDSGYYYY